MANVHPERHTLNELALLVEAVRDYAIFLLGPDGEIRSWNRGASRIFGYTPEQVIGRNFSMFYGPDDKNTKPPRELTVAEAEGRVEDEGWRIRSDGKRFWANTVLTALRDPSGKIIGFAKVTRDLTERRQADERLRRSEEMFRLLVSSVKDYAIFMLDPNGNVATWNAGARRIKGYEAEEIIGRHFSTFYPEEDVRAGKTERELREATANGSVEDEGWRIRKDGTKFWALVVITAVFDEGGVLRGFAKVTRDMTDRKHADEARQLLLEQREARLLAEEERRRAEASYMAAQEANRAKDEFLMTLSHELRTPMTAILGWARLLPSIVHDEVAFREAVASIGRSAKLQSKLIDDVLDVSRIVSGKLRLARETVDVEQVIRAAVEAVRPMAEARSVVVTSSASSNLGSITADSTRLQQVLWNLLTNAVKFTSKGGKVTLSAQQTASQLQISVTDTGEGIEPSFLPHVFEPFRQAENPTTRVHGGLGLGLSIVRYLVEAHGGSVRAESKGKGRGATFTLTLPIPAVRSNAEEGNSEGRAITAADTERLKNVRILVVDDDFESRAFIRAVVHHGGAEVTVADSADAAMKKFREERPDVVLTDVAMPRVDGYQLAQMIRNEERGGEVKIVALSAFHPGSSSAGQTGFDKYLIKPVEPADLLNAIARVLGR